MQQNNEDMIIVNFESSTSTMHFQYIHLPVCQLPVLVYD